MIKGAVFSENKKYRYALWRIWSHEEPKVMFICLNPSTADEVNDDPTLIRCMNYARQWGYGGVITSNLFAYRTSQPRNLREVNDPVGHENDMWIQELCAKVNMIVGGWGNHGSYLNRSKAVLEFIPVIHCLKINRSGEPSHPLYQPKSALPFRYSCNR